MKVEHNLQVESYFKYSCWDAFSPKKIKNEASTKSDVARSTSDGAYAIYVPCRGGKTFNVASVLPGIHFKPQEIWGIQTPKMGHMFEANFFFFPKHHFWYTLW